MIAYDSQFTPPAPILSIAVSGVVRQRPRQVLPALIDTGAEITAVPNTLLTPLKLYPFGRLLIEGIEAEPKEQFSYAVQLTYDGQRQELETVLTSYPFVILGRDWLQNYYLLLNGPSQTFTISQEPI